VDISNMTDSVVAFTPSRAFSQALSHAQSGPYPRRSGDLFWRVNCSLKGSGAKVANS
jgi:hypothetical protein